MKRKLPVLIALLLSLTLLAACGGTGVKPLPSGTELEKSLADAGIFSEELESVDADIAAYLYGLTEAQGVEIVSWYSSSGGTSEEITLFYCQNEDDLKAVREAADARLDFQKRTYADYAPAEIPKLEGAVVRARDKVLVVCVAADPDKAAKLLSPYFPA